MSLHAQGRGLYGYLAEYADEHDLLEAVHAAKDAGYRVMEAYTPLPVEEIAHAIGYKSRLPLVVLAGGVLGAVVGFSLQYWTSVHAYALNVGGRPLNSWPAFVVVTFETTVLFAALAAVFGMLFLNGLPRPHHPVFDVPIFELASRNRFFLMILARDPAFDGERTREHLEHGKSMTVAEVPA